MKFFVRDIDISSGGVPIALINFEDAAKLDIHVGDRIVVRKGKRKAHVVVDIASSVKVIDQGEIGLFDEVLKSLHAQAYDKVEVELADKPITVQYIKEKLEGYELDNKKMNSIISDVVHHRLTDVELAYFISACEVYGMSMKEIVSITKATVDNSDTLKFKNKIIVDKHCTGGVPGNRTTMILVPIMLAAGLTMPKTSSRAITSPAGTADTMEILAKVELSIDQLKKNTKKIGGFIAWGGSMNLAAADDKLIRIRNPLSLDPEGLLLSSIMAKKSAVGSTHVIIDIPIGKDIKIKSKKQAEHLRTKFVELGKKLGIKVIVVITDGSQPIGYGIGASLEARDVLQVLRNEPDAPQDLRKKSLYLASKLFDMIKKNIKDPRAKKLGSLNYARELLDSGRAYEKMKELIMAQGGNPNVLPDEIELGELVYHHKAPKKARISSIDNKMISKIARTLGSPVDQGAGIFLKVKKGYSVKKGDTMFIAYAKSKEKMNFAKRFFDKAIKLS